jgi:hypothetical protein
MPPHVRIGLLVVAGCIALGGLLAVGVHFAAPSAGGDLELMARNEPALMHLADAAASFAPEATPTPKDEGAKDEDEEKPEPDKAKTDEAEPEETAPPVRYRATSVFGAKQRGSLACRIPGQDSFMVEWSAASNSAVAHFANARIAGVMQQRANASNTIESALQFSLEDAGHSLSMTIGDGGAMRASVDGNDTAGTCSPA